MELKTARLLLRPFRETDAGDVFAYASDPRVGIIAGWPPHQSREESLRRQMTQDGHVYFIAYADGLPVGYVSVRPEGEGKVHLEKIYVLPAWQKKRVGGALFRHAVAYVRKRHPGARAIELNVNRRNPALDFYRHMGMRIDRQGDFDIGNGFYMNDYIMRLDL